MRKIWLCAAAVLFAGGLVNVGTPSADATLCGSVGGRFVDVTGCSDPLSYLNDALTPPVLRAAVGERQRVRRCGQTLHRQRLV